MATIVSTSTRTLDINSLFERPGDDSAETPLQALTGKFTQKLIDTPDYTLSLATFVGYDGEDGPSDGVLYELYLPKEDKIRRFSFPAEAVEYIQAYMTTTQQVTRIQFNAAKLAGRYSKLKGPVYGRKNILLTEIDVILREVKGLDNDAAEAPAAFGFIKNDDIMKLSPVMQEYGITIG